MDFRLTFGATSEDHAILADRFADVSGLLTDDLQELADLVPGCHLSARPGATGRGAAGFGIELIVEIGERVITDGASLYGVGCMLRDVASAVRRRRDRGLSVQDPATIGALAASSSPRNEERLVGARAIKTVSLTASEGLGTDVRDVWATSFSLPNGDVLAILSSPSGLVLGEVTVRPEWTEP